MSFTGCKDDQSYGNIIMHICMVLLAACVAIFIMHEAYAQLLPEPAVNENINAELNSNGIAYITHEVFNKTA